MVFRITAQRERRMPSLPGFCSFARRTISTIEVTDLPERNGPHITRKRAAQRMNAVLVIEALKSTTPLIGLLPQNQRLPLVLMAKKNSESNDRLSMTKYRLLYSL